MSTATRFARMRAVERLPRKPSLKVDLPSVVALFEQSTGEKDE